MIRHARHPRTVTTASLNVQGATGRGCLIPAACFPLLVATGVLSAVTHAINLISVAPTTDQNLTPAPGTNKQPARYFSRASICAGPAHGNQALCDDAVGVSRNGSCRPWKYAPPRTTAQASLSNFGSVASRRKAEHAPPRQVASATTAPFMRGFSPPSTRGQVRLQRLEASKRRRGNIDVQFDVDVVWHLNGVCFNLCGSVIRVAASFWREAAQHSLDHT